MSTIFADNFKNTSGGDPVNINEVKTDKLTGKTTAGSITIQGEGSGTTNLQQGLVKSWLNFNGTGTIAARDSFNHSGLTDVSQGNYTVTMVSAMGNANYTCVSGTATEAAGAGPRYTQFGSNHDTGTLDANFTTTAYSVNVFYPASTAEYDPEHIFIQVCGDLA
jgi:hypothetical protein